MAGTVNIGASSGSSCRVWFGGAAEAWEDGYQSGRAAERERIRRLALAYWHARHAPDYLPKWFADLLDGPQ
jgi:hypothetical protein